MASLAANVAALLAASASGSPDAVKASSEQLQAWETQPGFFHLVTSLALHNPDETGAPLAENTRFMAAVVFKNGIEKYWRRGADKYGWRGRGCLGRKMKRGVKEGEGEWG